MGLQSMALDAPLGSYLYLGMQLHEISAEDIADAVKLLSAPWSFPRKGFGYNTFRVGKLLTRNVIDKIGPSFIQFPNRWICRIFMLVFTLVHLSFWSPSSEGHRFHSWLKECAFLIWKSTVNAFHHARVTLCVSFLFLSSLSVPWRITLR
jgi:hypothetical protein